MSCFVLSSHPFLGANTTFFYSDSCILHSGNCSECLEFNCIYCLNSSQCRNTRVSLDCNSNTHTHTHPISLLPHIFLCFFVFCFQFPVSMFLSCWTKPVNFLHENFYFSFLFGTDRERKQ
jgi:hypothetical protein